MRKRKPPRHAPDGQRPQDLDPEARDIEQALAHVDLEALESASLELDPVLVEQARSHSKLKQITIRVGEEQLEIARKLAEQTGDKYQKVLRRWLADGASRALSRGLSK